MGVVDQRWGASQRVSGGMPPPRTPVPAPPLRRGCPPGLVAALPRVLWSDVVKRAGADCADAGSGTAPAGGGGPAERSGVDGDGAGKKVADDEDEHDVCAVCLCPYELDDVLLRLPCDHLFHEPCVARWLSQDSSCPQCRFQLVPPEDVAVSGGRAASEDPTLGTELVPVANSTRAIAAVAP